MDRKNDLRPDGNPDGVGRPDQLPDPGSGQNDASAAKKKKKVSHVEEVLW